MKQLSRLLTLLFLLVHLTGEAQYNMLQDRRVDPLLKQADGKDPGLRMFGRKPDKDGERYVNMAILNENTRKLKWFTCYGVAFDSVQLQADEYNGVTTGTLDPFAFYRNYSYETLFYLEQAEILYRLNGKAAMQDTAHNNRVVYNAAPVRAAKSTLQKLIAMEGLMKRTVLQLRLFDCKSPGMLFPYRNDSSRMRQKLAGLMIRREDSTAYFNTDPLATAAKIVLRRQAPDKLFVYDQEGSLKDSVPLKPDKYASLLKEKEDVFLLYRGWLELQWQQVAEGRRQYTARLQKLDSSIYRPVSWRQSRQQLQNALLGLGEQQARIDDKISSLIVPEQRNVGQFIADLYQDETVEISYYANLGFAYTIAYKRGHKRYELTDHRGNVMAVVSDKKKGVDENADGIIEYYNADVVSADDYYPFGMLQPGRHYSNGNKYRYGYNGKEIDNDVKEEGNQYDYGFRIYDPRIGRFLSVDPLAKTYPWYTPYQFAGNKPIWATDIDGLEENTTSTYVYRPPLLAVKPAFKGVISITDATSQTVHKTFEGGFNKLAKNDASKFSLGIVNSLVGSNVGTSASRLDITMTGKRSEVSKTWKGSDIKYFTQYSYSFTSNNVTEKGTFELATGTVQASARAWDPLAFLLLNKVVNSIVVTGLAKVGSATATEEMTTLYRSISKAEAESIQTTGQLSFAEGQMEVKQFWQTEEGFNKFNSSGFGGEYGLEMTVPKSMLGNGKPLNTATQVDEFFGPTATIDGAAELKAVNQSAQTFKITPIK